MKHLRIALENEDALEPQGELGELSEHVEALASITDGMPEIDDGPSSVSMEAFLRYKPGGCEELVTFRAAMESLTDTASVTVIGALVAAVAAVIALIVKAVKYFTSGTTGGHSGAGAITQAVAKRDALAISVNETKPLLLGLDQSLSHDPVQTKDGSSNVAVRSFSDILGSDKALLEKFKHVVEQRSDVTLLSAHKNPFIEVVRKLNGARSAYEHMWREVQQKYDRMSNLLLMDLDPSSKRSIDAYEAALEQARREILDPTFRGIDNRDMSAADVAAMFKEKIQEAKEEKLHGIPGLKGVIENVTSYYSDPEVDKALKLAGESMHYVKLLANELNESEQLLKAVQRDRAQLEAKESIDGSNDIINMLKEGNRLLSQTLTGYTKHIRAMISIINDVVSYSNHINDSYEHVLKSVAEIVGVLMKYKDAMPTEQATYLVDVTDQIKKLSK